MNRAPEALLALALDIVTTRAMTLICMLLFAGLASWCMWQPDYLRLAALGIFGLCAFLPVVKLESQQREGVKS